MARFDRFRISLLTAIAGCGPTGIGADSDSGPDSTSADEATETGDECAAISLCEDPVEIADGVVRCADGAINRIAGGSFDPIVEATPCGGVADTLVCTTDADCNEGPHGSCLLYQSYYSSVCNCVYACASDADCDEGYACLAPGTLLSPGWPSCQPASCRTNDDCGTCGECGVNSFHNGCDTETELACRGPDDECRTADDCPNGIGCDIGSNQYMCTEVSCFPGRPLLVDASARTAGDCRREDWAMTFTAGPSRDPELADYWAWIAALEHASVASFARFASQLLALGAPPKLLRETQRAALDEIRHARLAYGLASAYAGQPIGPSRLELAGVEIDRSWREIVGALIDEACVGETLGVAEAIAALELVEEPAVRAALEIIAEDEQRHAQLAWRCLAWLLRTASREDRGWALTRLNSTIAGLSGSEGGVDRPTDGVLGGARRAAVHRRAITEVLEPVARALAA